MPQYPKVIRDSDSKKETELASYVCALHAQNAPN